MERVSMRFGEQTVLNDISFHIEEKQFAVILGPSGAGKSTLLRCVNGLHQPSSGTVEVDGLTLRRTETKRIRRRVGFIFQGFNVIGNLSVLQNVLIGGLCRKPSWSVWFDKDEKRAAEQAIELVGLREKMHERAERLSGGQKQRVGIARVLAQRPKVVLADEPVASLDPVVGKEIMDILKRINKENGTTVVCNLHQLEYAKQYGMRIVGLNSGKVVFDGEPQALTASVLQMIYGDRYPPLSGPSTEAQASRIAVEPSYV